jgi:hypothetical protein
MSLGGRQHLTRFSLEKSWFLDWGMSLGGQGGRQHFVKSFVKVAFFSVTI